MGSMRLIVLYPQVQARWRHLGVLVAFLLPISLTTLMHCLASLPPSLYPQLKSELEAHKRQLEECSGQLQASQDKVSCCRP